MTATQHQITLINLTDGTVDGHAAGCADIKRRTRNHADEPWTFAVATKHDAWLEYNTDFLAEGEESGQYDINWLPCAKHVPQGHDDTWAAYVQFDQEPERLNPAGASADEEPLPKPMTKTEAYRWLARAREDVLDAKMLVYRAGSVTNVRETVLDAVGALTMLLDALDGEGINGITD